MKQEVCHRIMSESFIDRTHSPRYINLKNDQIRIDIVANTNKDGNTESAASTNAAAKSTGVDTDASSEGSDSDADTNHNQKKNRRKRLTLKQQKQLWIFMVNDCLSITGLTIIFTTSMSTVISKKLERRCLKTCPWTPLPRGLMSVRIRSRN